MPASTKSNSRSIWRKIRALRSPPAGIGFANCRRVCLRAMTDPPSMQHRRRSACSGPRHRTSRWPNIISMAHSRRPATMTPPPPRSEYRSSLRWPPITSNWRNGRKTVPRISAIARRWSAPKSPASKAGTWTRCISTSKPSARPAITALSRTRGSPMNARPRSTAHADSNPSPIIIYGRRTTVMRAGAPTARSGNSKPVMCNCRRGPMESLPRR